MSLILDGSNGLSDVDGSAATPAIRGTDTNTGIFFPAADTIAFSTGGTEQVRVTSAGDVGIGTTTPDAKLRVKGVSNGLQARFASDDGRGLAISTFISSGTNDNGVTYNAGFAADGQQVWQCGGTERMRIDTTGNLQFNSGYGSVATGFGCRAWVNFNGQGTVAIRASGNVSSITDGGVGIYTVNFTTGMPDTNYAVAAGTVDIGSGVGSMQTGTLSTGAFSFTLRYQDFAAYDWSRVFVTIFR
jgi:hypothetical protein